MEAIKVAQEIERKIRLLDKMKAEIKSRSEKKAETASNYDKQLAVTIMALQAGREMTLGGETIQNPTATITEKLAKGICWNERLEMDKAEGLYRGLLSNIEATKAQLNGWQSINRHLDEQ